MAPIISPPPLHLGVLNCGNSVPSIATAINRRSFLLTATSVPLLNTPKSNVQPPDTTITDRVFIDFSICPTYFRSDRTLSDDVASLCADAVPLGRLVFGLYGRVVPVTVSNFKTLCSSGLYRNTLVHKILPGHYFSAGRQGRRERGELVLKEPLKLERNAESVDPKAFDLTHYKGGVLSLCLSENDDEESVKLDPDYRNAQFLITTGPGPCPELDYKNIVFGTVLEGLDVIAAINSIPTYKPSDRIRQFNELAQFLGDERAQIARGIWNKPLKTIYISDCGVVQVAKPSLPPTLP